MYPTFNDLLRRLPEIINSSSYSSDTKGDYTGALVTRVNSLTNGISGEIFCDCYDIPDNVMFDENTVVDLSRVGSSETKSLIMGIIILKLVEYRMANANGANQGLRHVTVLEEAHNLLKRVTQGTAGSNVVGKSVEMICNSIAEMRTYGEGFVIVDQSPTAVDIAAIKNTNTKILMRLPEKGDCEAVGNAVGLNEDQMKELARLGTGVAVVMQNNWLEAVLAKIDAFSNKFEKEFVPVPFEQQRVFRGKVLSEFMYQFIQESKLEKDKLVKIIDESTIAEDKKKEMCNCIESAVSQLIQNDYDISYFAEVLLNVSRTRNLFNTTKQYLQTASTVSQQGRKEFTYDSVVEWKHTFLKEIIKFVDMTLKIIEANPVSNGLYVIAKETIEGVKAINKMIDVKDDPAKVLELKEKREREMDKSFTAALNKFKEDPVYGGLYVLGKEALYSVKAVMQMVNVKDYPAKVLELKEKREQEMDKSFTVALDRFKADPVYGGLYVIAKETIEGVKAINKMIDVKDDPAKVLELKEKRKQEMDKSFTAALDRFKTDPVYGRLYVIGKEIKESMKAFMQMIDVKDDPAKVLELKEKREQQREKSFDGWLGSGKNRDLSEIVDKHFHNVKKQETIQNVESTKTPEVLDIKDKLKGALNDTINSVYNEIIDKGPDFCKKIDGFVKECFDNPLLSLRVRASDGINYVFEQINNNKTVRSSIECPFYSFPNEKYSEILKGIDKDMVFKIGVQRLIPDVLQPILNLTNETSDRLNEDILQGTGNDAKDKQAPVVQIQNMLNVLYTGFSGVLLTQITDHFKASPGFTNMDVYAQMGIFTAAVLVGCGSLLMHETFKSIFDNYSKS